MWMGEASFWSAGAPLLCVFLLLFIQVGCTIPVVGRSFYGTSSHKYLINHIPHHINFSVLGARTLRSAKTSGLCIKQLMTNMWMDIISTSPTALKASVKSRNEILAVVFAFVCGDRSCMLLLKFLACPSFSLSMRFFFWQSILFKPLAIL